MHLSYTDSLVSTIQIKRSRAGSNTVTLSQQARSHNVEETSGMKFGRLHIQQAQLYCRVCRAFYHYHNFVRSESISFILVFLYYVRRRLHVQLVPHLKKSLHQFTFFRAQEHFEDDRGCFKQVLSSNNNIPSHLSFEPIRKSSRDKKSCDFLRLYGSTQG